MYSEVPNVATEQNNNNYFMEIQGKTAVNNNSNDRLQNSVNNNSKDRLLCKICTYLVHTILYLLALCSSNSTLALQRLQYSKLRKTLQHTRHTRHGEVGDKWMKAATGLDQRVHCKD